jgi:patatin-like phospholipase/acyl hydrolase
MVDDAGTIPASSATGAPESYFQILALDGGGAKALFTAHVLARLEEDLDTSIVGSFDLIAGTSAGGVVALALGSGLRPAEIAEHFTDLAATVFPRSRRRSPKRLVRPAYRAGALRTALEDVLGDRLLGESAKRLLIPSWDVQVGSVHVFKTPHHPRLRRDWRVPMVDVAMATTAAPTYFPAARVHNHRLIDGGVWANNPSVIAISEAVSMLHVPLTSIRLLNVGTMDAVDSHAKKLDNGGLVAWATPAAPLLLTASSRGGQGTAEHLIGKGNYERFDARVPGGLYGLDRIDPNDLAGIANTVSRELSPTYAERFADHRAAKYTPMAGPAAPATTSTATQPGGPQ